MLSTDRSIIDKSIVLQVFVITEHFPLLFYRCALTVVVLSDKTHHWLQVMLLYCFFMSPLRRHIFVCFMAKSAFLGFFGPSSVHRGRTHIVSG